MISFRRRTTTWLVAGAVSLAVAGAGSVWRAAWPQSFDRVGGRRGRAAIASGQPSPVDRGIGVVFFDRRPGSDTREGDTSGAVRRDSVTADTLTLLRDTTRRQVLARYIMRSSGMSWSFALETSEDVRRASLEFEYEIEGLPVDLVTPDERWVRAIYGTTPDGSARFGWVRLRPGLARYRAWPPLLREQSLFFDAGIAPEFYGSPGGPVVSFPLERGANGAADYIMHPMEVRDGWMRVRVATPSDYCAEPGSVRQSVMWIRYLSDTGRPRVWYHARGC